MEWAMEYSEILFDVDEHIARVTLNRPEKRNPIGPVTVNEVCHALERARDDEAVRVVILTGAGKAFSAGGDLSQMSGGGQASEQTCPPRSFVDLNLLLTRMGKPTIAMVNGVAMGGGLGLVVACDLAVAADTAVLATPEIKVGLWPMMIMANIFRNVGRKQAFRMVLTGEKIPAEEALRMGLVSHVAPAGELEQQTMDLAHTLASRSPVVMRLGLTAFNDMASGDLEQSLTHLEGQLFEVLKTEDAREGLMAFLQKRPPKFKGR